LEAFHGDFSPLYEKITHQSFQRVANDLFESSEFISHSREEKSSTVEQKSAKRLFAGSSVIIGVDSGNICPKTFSFIRFIERLP